MKRQSGSRPSPAVAKLLAAADEVLALAQALQMDDRGSDALECAMYASEYVRAARAMQDMEDAIRALSNSPHD